MSLKMSQICDEEFFTMLSLYVAAETNPTDEQILLRLYIRVHAKEFANMIRFYYDFEVLESITLEDKEDVAEMIGFTYGDNWVKLYMLERRNYDPLANKDLVETEKTSGSDTLKRDDSTSANGTTQFDRKDETSVNQSTTYDNTEYVPTTKAINTGGSTTTANGTSSLDRTDKTTYGKETEFTSKGNIGVMPTQDLYEREVSLRLSKHFEDMLIASVVDSMISGVFTDGT